MGGRWEFVFLGRRLAVEVIRGREERGGTNAHMIYRNQYTSASLTGFTSKKSCCMNLTRPSASAWGFSFGQTVCSPCSRTGPLSWTTNFSFG